MREANIFKRILSCMLVLTLIMSGLGLDLGGITKDNNVVKVEAAGDGTGYSVGGSPGSGKSASLSTSDGSWSGIRFTWVPAKLMSSGKYFKGKWSDEYPNVACYTADKIFKNLSCSEVYSVVVTKFANARNLYCLPNRGDYDKGGKIYCEQLTCSSLNDIFGKVIDDEKGVKVRFPEEGWNDHAESDGEFSCKLWDGSTFDVGKNNSYFGATGKFNKILEVEGNADSMFNAFNNFLKDKGRGMDSSFSSNNMVLIAEPVVISHVTDGSGLRRNTDVNGKYFALSLQDCLHRNQKGDKWSYAFTQAAYPCVNEVPNTYIKQGGMWRTLLFNMKNYYFRFIDKNGVFIHKENSRFMSGIAGNKYWDTGFAVFNTDIKGDSGAKTGVSYTLFTSGSADNVSQSINSVWAKSLGAVSSSNSKTIKVALDDDEDTGVLDDRLESGVTGLIETTYSSDNGEYVVNSDNKKADNKENLSKQLTGRKVTGASGTWSAASKKYTNQGFGVVKIPYNNGGTHNISTLYKATTGADALKSITSNIKIKTNRIPIDNTGAVSIGSKYYLSVDGVNESYNIAKAVADTINDTSRLFINEVRGTKVTFSRLGILDDSVLNNYAINGALYALKCSKMLESYDTDSGKYNSRELETTTSKEVRVEAVLDANGNQVYMDDDGNVVTDGSGTPQFKEVLDSNGNPIYDIVEEPADPSELSTMGISVMLMAKKNEITSHLVGSSLDRDTGVISKQSYKSTDYDVTEQGSLTIPAGLRARCFYVVVSNNSLERVGITPSESSLQDILSKFAGNEELSSLAKFKSSFLNFTNLSESDIAGSGDNLIGGASIALGGTSNEDADAVDGYSVFVLEVTGNVTKKSDLKLMDYELNYIYPSMLTDGDYGNLTSDISYKTLSNITVGCMNHPSITYKSSDDKFVQASSSYAGNIIDKNKTLDINKNILQYDTYTGGIFTTELKARNGYTFTDNLTNVRFSLAVNLIRSSFGDKRVLSSITSQKSNDGVVGGIDEDYAKDNLDLTFANKPNTQVSASALRDSKAQVGTDLNDLFEWNVSFVDTDCSPYRSDLKTDFARCSGHGYNPRRYCAPVTWYETIKTEVPASDFGEKVRYKITERAYKYQSDVLDTGKNDTKTVADSLQKPTNGKGSNSSLVSPYKIAVVHSSNSELSFYPEVMMRAYSSTGDMVVNASTNSGDENNRSAGGYVTPHNLLTMGEVIRKVKPSAMYVIRVNHKYDSGTEVNPAIKGSTISDSTAVGTNADAVSDGKPVIYAGGDVTVKVNPDFRLNMYGYSLDLIETSDNNLVGTGNYASVVNDSSNVKRDWGNTYTSTDIKKEFDDWSKDILTKHLGVDMTLTVNGSGVDKVFNNFTSSLGNMDTSASVADGVYSIKIIQGTIDKTQMGYKKLIHQIKLDYELSTDAEAEKIFTNSDIWQSIERAIEDSNDSFNNSQKSDAINDSRAHWYDEEVKTFVIRRYKKENLEIKNVVVNDKIDYGAAPTADDTTASLNSYKKADAKWYMTLYLKKDGAKKTPECFSDNLVYYNPSNYGGLSNANDTGSVLINEVYVDGADFVIPSASTYDMGN